MLETTLRLIFSWHTSSDIEIVDKLASILRIHGFSVDYISMLPNGLPSTQSPYTIKNWINTFIDLLNGSIGVLAIFSEQARESYYMGGMAIERAICYNSLSKRERDEYYKEVIAPYPVIKKTTDEIRRHIKGAEDRDIELPEDYFEKCVKWEKESSNYLKTSDWAQNIYLQISGWLSMRSAIGPVSMRRYCTAECNLANEAAFEAFEKRYPYVDIPWESALYSSDWCIVSMLDDYNRVWHCSRCYATSDVWNMGRSRLPEVCPACGFGGSKS